MLAGLPMARHPLIFFLNLQQSGSGLMCANQSSAPQNLKAQNHQGSIALEEVAGYITDPRDQTENLVIHARCFRSESQAATWAPHARKRLDRWKQARLRGSRTKNSVQKPVQEVRNWSMINDLLHK
jgi:hypothetical protein